MTSICGLGQVALGPVMSVLRRQRTRRKLTRWLPPGANSSRSRPWPKRWASFARLIAAPPRRWGWMRPPVECPSRRSTRPHALPGFDRSSVDGFAVRARNTFGASDAIPAYLRFSGAVKMGAAADVTVGPGRRSPCRRGDVAGGSRRRRDDRTHPGGDAGHDRGHPTGRAGRGHRPRRRRPGAGSDDRRPRAPPARPGRGDARRLRDRRARRPRPSPSVDHRDRRRGPATRDRVASARARARCLERLDRRARRARRAGTRGHRRSFPTTAARCRTRCGAPSATAT